MFTDVSHGFFEVFNCNPRDAYVALRGVDEHQWRLYRMEACDGGVIHRLVGHFSEISQARRVADQDAEHREVVRKGIRLTEA